MQFIHCKNKNVDCNNTYRIFFFYNKHPVKKSNKEITLIKEMGKEWGNEMSDLVHGKIGVHLVTFHNESNTMKTLLDVCMLTIENATFLYRCKAT